MANVVWQKCGIGWCDLLRIDLAGVVPVSGVYLIWKSTPPGQTVRVGQGDIVKMIQMHRNDPAVLAHLPAGGQLAVSWAAVPAADLNGVERYLAETLTPLVKTPFANVPPIPVNLPA
jgi:hypothetical protein